MSSTLRNGETRDLNLTATDYITLVAVSGTYTATVVQGNSRGTVLGTNATGGTYGPYTGGAVIRVVTSASSEIDFDIGASPVIVSDTFVTASTNPVTGGIRTTAAGVEIPVYAPSQSVANLPAVMAFGNSIPRQNQVGYNGTANQVAYNAHLWWAMAFSGQPFQWAQTGVTAQLGADANSTYGQGIYGYGGATSTQILPFFAQTVGTVKPAFCFIELMENDVTAIVGATLTRAQAKANYLSVIRSCVAQGTTPVFIGCLPSKSYSTAAHAAEYWALTDYVESLQTANPTLIYVPVHDLYTDSSISTPQPLSAGIYANYTDASAHPYAAAPLIGARIADVLAARGVSGFGLLPGPGDARYVAGNVSMSGTAGTVSAPLTAGTAPTGLTVNATATVIGTPTVVDRNNKQSLQVPITSGTSVGLKNAFAVFTANITLAAANNSAVGDLVQFFTEVTIDSATTLTGLRDFYQQLTFTGGGNDAYSMKKASGDLFDTITIPSGRKMLLATPIAAIPASTTGLRPFFFATASNAAAAISGKFWISKFAVVNWSKVN